jgi:hypothetical protein
MGYIIMGAQANEEVATGQQGTNMPGIEREGLRQCSTYTKSIIYSR